jgi:hypothetical protein
MRRAHAGEAPDLVLDGDDWVFEEYTEASRAYHKLTAHKGATWPDWPATTARLFPEYAEAQALATQARKARKRQGRVG